MLNKLLLSSLLALPLMACTHTDTMNDDEIRARQNQQAKHDSDGQGAEVRDLSKFDVDANGKINFKAEIVYFQYDDSTLTEEGMQQLQALAHYMLEHAETKLKIEGNCDDRGSVEYNLALGQRRSVAVMKYLMAQNVPMTRLDPVSYGEEKPAAEGENEAAWKLNRRAEFVFVKD